jgi:hypothetical protein
LRFNCRSQMSQLTVTHPNKMLCRRCYDQIGAWIDRP